MNDVRVIEVRDPEGSRARIESLIKNCFATAEEGWHLNEIRDLSYQNKAQNTTEFIGWLLILVK